MTRPDPDFETRARELYNGLWGLNENCGDDLRRLAQALSTSYTEGLRRAAQMAEHARDDDLLYAVPEHIRTLADEIERSQPKDS